MWTFPAFGVIDPGKIRSADRGLADPVIGQAPIYRRGRVSDDGIKIRDRKAEFDGFGSDSHLQFISKLSLLRASRMFSFQVVVFPAIAAILLLAVKQLFERYVSWRTANAPVLRSTTAPLPLDWYQNQDLYELEKRAVFSKKWLLVTHKSRLPENGSWVRYQDVANFQFFLVRDNDGNVNGFHNVCRHRAYPVVEGEKGKNMVLSCKYHGWSYGLKGNLAKAPGYQDMPAFDKSKNGLFKVHTHVDAKGFVWVNFNDSIEKPALWASDVQDADKFFRLEKFNLDDYNFDHVLEMNGNYNWKAFGNSYNEWFHTMEAEHIDVHHSTVRNYYFPNAAVTAS